ncbi:hypothetical protein JCM3774_006275 [Rhodotorula dairenensis]
MTEQRSTGSGATRNAADDHERAHASSTRAQTGATRASKRSRTARPAPGQTTLLGGREQLHRPDDNDDLDDGDGDHHGDAVGGDPAHLPPLSKHATEKEKEARRMARMIRNRNAAQASRDRKKEHTAFLERRVAQLETLLRQAGRPAPAAPTTTYSFAAPLDGATTAAPSRLRATSVSSSTSSSEDNGRIADLEDENESLRAQLQVEQTEKAQLLARLELVEEKLARLTTPDAGPISFSPFSGTSTPLPAYEPTFAFNTPDIKPLPQPEERAFVEERERQRRRVSHVSFDHVAASLGPPFTLDRSGPPSMTTTEGLTESQSQDRTAEATGSCPPTAALSTFPLGAHRAAAPSTPSHSSGTSSASGGSVSGGLELDISSTPPTSSESYLDLHDLDVSPEWSAWAKAGGATTGATLLPLDSKASSLELPHEHADDDESALAFLDLSAFHDVPMTMAADCDRA